MSAMRIAALATIVAVAFANPSRHTVTEIQAHLTNGHYDVIIDVRSQTEYEKSHIHGAIHMPGYTGSQLIKGCEHHKVGVYCFLGSDRATPAAQWYASQGFKKVFDLGGLKFLTNAKTASGSWDKKLPACAGTPKTAYVSSTSRLSPIDFKSFDQDAQAAFKASVAAGAWDTCGASGVETCTAKDVTITSIDSARRGAVSVSYTLAVTQNSEATAKAKLTSYMGTAGFRESLEKEGLPGITQATVTTPPASAAKPTAVKQAPVALGPIMIPSNDVQEKLAAKAFDFVVDIRSSRAYANGHVPGAINLCSRKVLTVLEGCEDAKIGVYCSQGFDRATPMSAAMSRHGFKHVYDLGGIEYMKGLTPETGKWDGKLPACAKGESKGLSLMCILLYGLLVIAVIAIVIVAFLGCVWAISPATVVSAFPPSTGPTTVAMARAEAKAHDIEAVPQVGVVAIAQVAPAPVEAFKMETLKEESGEVAKVEAQEVPVVAAVVVHVTSTSEPQA